MTPPLETKSISGHPSATDVLTISGHASATDVLTVSGHPSATDVLIASEPGSPVSYTHLTLPTIYSV